MEGIMAEGKAYYKDYDVEIPETLSAYGYGDSPLTFVSLSDYNGMRKLQGMDSVDLLENNYRILYNKENVRGLAEQFHDKSINLTIEENVLSPVNEAEEFTMSNSDMGQIIFVVADTWMKNMNVDTMIWNVQCVSEDAAKEFDTLLDNSVLYGGYSQRAQSSIRFRYLYSSDRMRMKIFQSFPNIGNQFIRGFFTHLYNGGVICTLCLAPLVLLDRAVCQHDIFFAGYDVH